MNIMKLMRLRHDFYAKHPELGADHLHLLERIGIHESEGRTLTVTDAMKLKDVSSPATIHRMMDALEASGLVEKHSFPFDKRAKYLRLSKQSRAYFNKLDREMGRM